MKRIPIISAAVIVALLAACSGGSGTKFNPTERESSMTDEERQAAIDKKKAEYDIDLDVLLNSRGVKFSILEPITNGDISPEISKQIAVKMLEIACKNGISGVGNAPGFVLGVEIVQTGRSTTGTTPQKMIVKYALTFNVANTATGDVFATASQDITGVGNSFEEANLNAVKEIKNTPQMQKMLATASDRIIEWYETNLQTLKNQVESAAKRGEYDLALALVSSVPEQAKTAFQYASSKQPELLDGMLHMKAASSLAEMQAALAASGDNFNPAIAAYLSLIPADSPEHAKAQQLFAEYDKKCAARRAALEAKAALDSLAAREFEKWKLEKAHEKELVEIEASKVRCKYESMASAKAMEKAMRYDSDQKHKSFWGKLGDRVLGGIDFLGDKVGGDDWDE